MPDHADAPVTRLGVCLRARCIETGCRGFTAGAGPDRRAQRFFNRDVDRVKLVVARHLLGELAVTLVFEHQEVSHQVEKAALLEHTFEHHLQFGKYGRRILLAGDGAPWLEPLLAGTERADARLHAVGGQQHRVGGEQRRNLRLIRLQLMVRAPDGGVLVGRVLELDHGQRQSIDEQHHVRPARVLSVGDRELVDGEPVVVVGSVEVDHLRLRASDGAVGAAILHCHAIHQHAVHGVIPLHERRRVGARQLAEGILQCVGRQIGIMEHQCLTQAGFQHHIAVGRVGALSSGHAHGDVGAMQHGILEARQPGESGLFHDGFGESAHAGSQAERRESDLTLATASSMPTKAACPRSITMSISEVG